MHIPLANHRFWTKKGDREMTRRRERSDKAAAGTCLRFIVVLLPIAALAAGVNTYIATRVASTAEDSLKMTKEAEDNVSQLETVLDGTPQGWQRLMLTAKKIYELGDLATPALLRLASSKRANPMLRKMAIEIIRDLKDPRAIGPFTRIARDTTNPEGVRHDAVSSLGYYGTDEVIDSLLQFLHSPEPLLKYAALCGIRALPRAKEKDRLFQPVVELATRCEDSGMRSRAILALSAFSDKAVPLLTELLEDADEEVRCRATYALSRTWSSLAADPLVRLLSHDDQEVRGDALMAMMTLRDTTTVPALIQVLHRGGRDASRAALTLSQIGDRRALVALDSLIQSYANEGKDAESLIRARNCISRRYATGRD